ncbi:unnamed protein product [Gemmataceae bacterium]|nr:unnamed protein product [Gemmataceae bacterium]VTT99357.1 unnamed protein product [Gemmataceae bacterium]
MNRERLRRVGTVLLVAVCKVGIGVLILIWLEWATGWHSFRLGP